MLTTCIWTQSKDRPFLFARVRAMLGPSAVDQMSVVSLDLSATVRGLSLWFCLVRPFQMRCTRATPVNERDSQTGSNVKTYHLKFRTASFIGNQHKLSNRVTHQVLCKDIILTPDRGASLNHPL